MFYEYGASDELTIGFDAGFQAKNSDVSAIFFARYPILRSSGPDVFAVELGFGAVSSADETAALIRSGLSWGRGYALGSAAGWIGIESTYALRSDGSTLGKIDTTLGVNHANGSLSILQVQFADPSDGTVSLALAPAYVAKLSDSVFLEMGGNYEFQSGRKALKLGVWFSY